MTTASKGFCNKTEVRLEGWNQSGTVEWWKSYFRNVSAIICRPSAEREAIVENLSRHIPKKLSTHVGSEDSQLTVNRNRFSRIFSMRKDLIQG